MPDLNQRQFPGFEGADFGRQRSPVPLGPPRRQPYNRPPKVDGKYRSPAYRFPQQGEQLDMVKPTKWVIENVTKIDASEEAQAYETPEQQWDEVWDHKTEGAVMRGMDETAKQGDLPPLRLQRHDRMYGSSGEPHRPQLWDGHHRLAAFENSGFEEVPVWHSFNDYERDPYTGSGYHKGRRDWRAY